MISEFFTLFKDELLFDALLYVWKLWPVWVPLLLVYEAFHQWMSYKRREWIKGQGGVLLEIRLPNEQMKSPAVMEVFMQSLHQTGVGTVSDVFFKGQVRPWFSLELVSDGGEVHFYIWMHAKWKKSIETQLYALFPNIEVMEVPDYTLGIRYDREKYKFSKMWNIILTKADAYPIKTYIDFGLDKDQDEEYKNDPIAPMIEFLGSLKKGEYAWYQILVQGHSKEGFKLGRLVTKPDWKDAANAEIKEIAKKAKFKTSEDKGGDNKFLSEEQKNLIEAIERSIEKPAFDTMIRAFYFSETEVNNPNNIGGLFGSFKSFSSNTLNGFRPGYSANYEYMWQDFGDLMRSRNEREMLEAYKRRSFFSEPFKHLGNSPYILTSEELATLYHFPSSMVVATPTLARIPSKKAEAPSNLPT